MSDRAAALRRVVEDFADESRALGSLLETLDEDTWLTPTPAAGWDIRDSVAHLAVGDELALECVVYDRNPTVMDEGLAAVIEGEEAAAAFEQRLVDRGRALPPRMFSRGGSV